MEDAGLRLGADLVAGGAHERAVVHGGDRDVGEGAGAGVGHSPAARHADHLGRVVERPPEVDVGRVGGHLAQDVDHLVLTHAVDHGDAGRTDGHVWNFGQTIILDDDYYFWTLVYWLI